MNVQVGDLISLFQGLTLAEQALVIATLALAVALISLFIIVTSEAVRLWRAGRGGRRASVSPREVIPPTNFARDGRPSDPLNVRVIGTADQLSVAFVLAGWYRADELTYITSLRISFDALLGRKYSSAPVSDLYLYGRKQDFAFEKPGHSVRQRDHVRFWRAKLPASDGRPVWIGGATRDDKVELSRTDHLPTHGIAPDVDAERNLIADDLIATGWVVAERSVPDFPGPTRATNAMGDEYYTDGQAILLTLARTQPVPLLPQLVREPGAGLVRGVARRLRRNLPRQGRELAREWRERRTQAKAAKQAGEEKPAPSTAPTPPHQQRSTGA